MRLIDVDSLLETTNWLVFADNKVDVAYVQVADIMRQPTVEAVPVEWIERYYGDNPAIWADKMIEEWRVEHETD